MNSVLCSYRQKQQLFYLDEKNPATGYAGSLVVSMKPRKHLTHAQGSYRCSEWSSQVIGSFLNFYVNSDSDLSHQ